MYKITVQTLIGDEHTIYVPGNEDYTVTSAELSLSAGSAGEFNFTIPYSNPRYDEIVDHSIITVYEDNLEIWRGDIQDIRANFDKSLSVYCLEDLAWLGEEAVAMTSITNQTYAQRFSAAITTYNSNQVAKRQFQVGMLTSITTSNMCTWQPKYEEDLLTCLRNYIADDGLVRIRRVIENGSLVRYVDIVRLQDYGQQADQKIEFGSNLLDFVKEMDNTNFLNVIYPYGKETETPLYGEIMQRVAGTPLQNDASIAAFGRRARSVIFETESLAKLNSLAQSYLNRYSQPSMKIEVKAVDLGNIEAVARIHLGDSVRIIANTFGIDQWSYATQQDIDLLNIANNQITLSDAVRVQSLTSMVAEQAKEIEEARTPASVLDEAKRNAWAILEGDNGGIVTFEINGEEQIVGIHIANNLDLSQATKAWGWNLNGLVYMHRDYPTDDWVIGIAMTMDGSIVADYITTGSLSADRINGGHIKANLITALNSNTSVGNNTLADFATKATTIIDVDVEYAKNQSSTTAPTSGWSTTSPQWEEGYYIWQRTKTTDGNNQASYSTAVCIQGAKGEDGQQGATGIGVSAIEEQYYLSTSDQTRSGGSWSTDQPAWEEGKYIWTRSKVTWTNSIITYTDPILAKAINGANEAVQNLDDDLDQDGVFNRLIGSDTAQGIVLSNGKLYLRGEYLTAGAITIGGAAYASNPTLLVKDTSGNTIGQWTKDGLTIKSGNGTVVFSIDANGNVSISGYATNSNVSASVTNGINGLKTDMSKGNTTISGGCITTGTLSASKITSGTIDASKVTVENLNASKINAGSLMSTNYEEDYSNPYADSGMRINMSTGVVKSKIMCLVGNAASSTNHDAYFRGIRVMPPQYTYEDTFIWVMGDTDDFSNSIRISSYDIAKITNGSWSYVSFSSSDRSQKENIKPLDVALSIEFINKTSPKEFKFKNLEGRHYGMIAQDVRELLDDLGENDSLLEVVHKEKDGDIHDLNYHEYIPHLINYVKDLRAEIEALKNIINTLKEEK